MIIRWKKPFFYSSEMQAVELLDDSTNILKVEKTLRARQFKGFSIHVEMDK